MISKITLAYAKHKALVHNFSSLYFLRITNIIIPLAILPYLVRVLGVEKFGTISFAQAFALFFVIIVDFGFDLSMTREISVHSHDLSKVSQIASAVFVIKLFLVIVAFLVYCLIVFNADKFSKYEMFYLYMYGTVIGQGFFPTWYFQGMQKMKYLAILNFIVKILTLILVFVFIKSERDFLAYPIIMTISYLALFPLVYYYIKKDFLFTFSMPTVSQIIYYTKYSSSFFVSRIGVRFSNSTALFVVGLIGSETAVGYYAMADKLKSAIVSLYGPVVSVLYPYLSKYRDILLYRKLLILINILNIIGLIILFFFAAEILEVIFGTTSNLSVELLRILAVSLLFDVPSILIGYPLLGAAGHENYANYSVVFAGVFYLILLAILYALDVLDIQVVAYAYLAIIILEFGIRAYGVKKYHLLSEEQW